MSPYLAVFTKPRMLTTLLLGFSGGLPLALVGGTLQAWLARENVDIATIGLFALVGIPYALKFLWAPLMDLRVAPILGLRRGWMVIAQLGLLISTVAMAMLQPTEGMFVFSLVAFLLAFFSASQDIVIDAYRTEMVEDDKELGAAASTYIVGYRVATLVSGGVALVMADQMSWQSVYLAMAAINLIGLATILLSPEPNMTRPLRTQSLSEAVFKPFTEFFHRSGAMEILIFVMVYKLSTLMATALTTKFLIDLGYSNTMIGTVNKGAGLIATLAGTLAGGSLMAKLGLKRSLWIFGIAQASVGLTFYFLSHAATLGAEHKDFWLVIVVSLDQFMMGMGTAALVGFMMNVCSRQFTATQYALLSSVMAVSRVILVAHAGTLVEFLGYDLFFILTVPLALPGLLLLRRFDHWRVSEPQNNSALSARFDMVTIVLFVVSLICLSSDPIWRLFNLKEVSTAITLAGAIGVLLVVVVGLVRPYLRLAER